MQITLKEIAIVITRSVCDHFVGGCIGLAVRPESEGDEWNTSELRGFDVKPLVQADLRRVKLGDGARATIRFRPLSLRAWITFRPSSLRAWITAQEVLP